MPNCIRALLSSWAVIDRPYNSGLRACRGALRAPAARRQGRDTDFFEEHNVVIPVVLNTDVAFERSWTTIRLVRFAFWRRRLAFGVVGHFHAVQRHNRSWTV